MKSLALRLIAACRTFGPYLAIELLLPGGSLLALLLWLCRRHAKRGNHDDLVTPCLAADCVASLNGTAKSPKTAEQAWGSAP